MNSEDVVQESQGVVLVANWSSVKKARNDTNIEREPLLGW